MDEILHHFETMVETIVSWYLQGHHHSRVSWVVRTGFRPSTVVRVRPGVPAEDGAGGTEQVEEQRKHKQQLLLLDESDSRKPKMR